VGLVSHSDGSAAGWATYLYNVSGTLTLYLYSFDDAVNINKATTFSTATWYHIAIVRSGNSWYWFKDGTQIGTTGSSSGSLHSATTPLKIGYRGDSGYLDGSIDEFRLSKGIARWTSNFTPSTTEYESDEYTKLLLHMDTQDVSGDYEGNTYKIPTFFGTAQLDTAQKKFGTASYLFDGDSDYLTIPSSADWNFGSGNWTVDFWIRFNNAGVTQGIYNHSTDVNNKIEIIYSAATGMNFVVNSGGETIAEYQWSWTPSIDTWYHIATVRNNTNIYCFVNGISLGDGTITAISTTSLPNIAQVIALGVRRHSLANWFGGYIDEFRISKGTARWTSNFTPPIEEYGIDSGTSYIPKVIIC
jgi:hypothetical protein